MTKTKNQPVSQSIAIYQSDFHVHAAADYFIESSDCKRQGVKSREKARNKFMEHVKIVMPILGLDDFLLSLKIALSDRRHEHHYAEAEAISRQLWSEMQSKPSPATVAVSEPQPKTAKATKTKAEDKQSEARRLLDAAIRLLSETTAEGVVS